jgi:hypothetical protein
VLSLTPRIAELRKCVVFAKDKCCGNHEATRISDMFLASVTLDACRVSVWNNKIRYAPYCAAE